MRPCSGLHKISYRHSSAITVMILCKSKTRPAPPTACYIILYYINHAVAWTVTIRFLELSSFGSFLNEFISCPCYIISFILNSRFGQRYWLRELFAFGSKNSRSQSASARPPCSKAAILFYPPAVPFRQFPALSIRFKGCLFSRLL